MSRPYTHQPELRAHALADAIAVLRSGGSFADVEDLTGIPAREIRRSWNHTLPEEGDRAQPEAAAA